MPKQPNCFIPFKQLINAIKLPKRFTFPFFYSPCSIAIAASEELQHFLTSNELSLTSGKMFGVLVVKTSDNNMGYLAAYSGKSASLESFDYFVPAISNQLEENPVFVNEQQSINQLNTKISVLEQNPKIAEYKQQLKVLQASFDTALVEQQQVMTANRKTRKQQRASSLSSMDEPDVIALHARLAQQSVNDKNQLRDLKQTWRDKILEVTQCLSALEDTITALKSERQKRSSTLQIKLFEQYQILNSRTESMSLPDIFESTPQHIPPAGAGDCAAPKLLQYAFQHNLTPIALAEFWWGEAPKSEIRQHKNFYPACIGKCEPILNWMLTGMDVDDNPLLLNKGEHKDIEIVFEDEHIAVINKPFNLLSVSGKHIKDSVQSRMKTRYPHATSSLIVHRLDMPTSGLMVIALTKRAQKSLQKQFINRDITKHYVALLDGKTTSNSGKINLPLRGDLHDRPRQIVCKENGKPAETTWEVIEYTSEGKTKVSLSPHTGRTHQLRVHCAHHSGLNIPIVGDDLYGTPADRLYLHAEKLTLTHPITKQRITFEASAQF